LSTVAQHALQRSSIAMGSGHSTAKAAEEQQPENGTTLFGSWDKPVADAYALKKQVSKKGRAVVNKAADAAGAAAGSTFQMEAGAGVKPSGAKATSAKKGPGTVYDWLVLDHKSV